ncbi:MAG TPA: hypothetical protein DEG17_19115 [Cyanobacteria bacterium UBA11149]|nr:hypothetical protein [Cyanobacteria bacterium UBA11367]HBE57184.1 hypothetical protein [Cyanobacteria bacterium UBA11366]HBK62350.1 hypothetical protein [Cyanobacteria bacterium UBA11166]HBR74158.1 hypothetical protein [Cyanobacteria bacterium UBA11159]HBS71478.1 hypothetical protein [Cyanobacteria bacterium UBA11153]HBW90919.1 hypothetical protein [Cyanobacteria bacterium UBA11149]HCA93551.1 hypothetical protein [Cyanobacteria bacterium UBA9226]
MKIYIQSRGFTQENGYRWLPEMPYILTNESVLEKIQVEAPSLVLRRYDKRLLLLITGIQSNRKDFRDRNIRNSVAWVTTDTQHHERQLRAIAIIALRDWNSLCEEINRTIEFDARDGFHVLLEEIKALPMKIPSLPQSQNLPHDEELNDQISKNLEQRQEELAALLENYALPRRSGFLVIVTEIKGEEALIQAKVWRGLSRLVKSDNWQIIANRVSRPPKTQPAIDFSDFEDDEKRESPLPILIVSAILTGMMLLGIFF